jgi:hypothetical protein
MVENIHREVTSHSACHNAPYKLEPKEPAMVACPKCKSHYFEVAEHHLKGTELQCLENNCLATWHEINFDYRKGFNTLMGILHENTTIKEG